MVHWVHIWMIFCMGVCASVACACVEDCVAVCVCWWAFRRQGFLFKPIIIINCCWTFFFFFLSVESTRICHNSFHWLDQCLLPGNISLLNTLHQKVMGCAQALLSTALQRLGNTNSNFGIWVERLLCSVFAGRLSYFVRVYEKYVGCVIVD